MKSELAERLLGRLMGWDVPRFALEIPRLQALAAVKFDEYGGYGAGMRFIEYLARWLEQFSDDERELAYDFVSKRLVFISNAEMTHIVEVAYPDFIEPILMAHTAKDLAVPPFLTRRIAGSREFLARRRRTLILGMSDGARLDLLRRSTPLSHEQFAQGLDVDSQQALRMRDKLVAALQVQRLPGDGNFQHVVLVDDFSGSGRTLIRIEESDDGPRVEGKLWRFHERVASLTEANILASDADVCILLYVASDQAVEQVRSVLARVGLEAWRIVVVQLLPREIRVDLADPDMAQLCRTYYDPSSADAHKQDAPLGYSDCALPLVLSHNTPNNSIFLLWAETDPESALGRKALFPRYERHHRDRP